MTGIPSPLAGMRASGDSTVDFVRYDTFVSATVPDPGPFLEGQDVLNGTEHAAFHRLSKRLFEDRGVYDVTFGYNLARLNVDRRHPNAGYRYAAEVDNGEAESDERTWDGDAAGGSKRVLRAEFTPTTPFCPQSKSLTMGSYRAWNGEAEYHEYDRVRVRVHPMHHRSESINEALASLDPEVPQAEGKAEGSPPAESHSDLLRDRIDGTDADGEESGATGTQDGVDLSEPF